MKVKQVSLGCLTTVLGLWMGGCGFTGGLQAFGETLKIVLQMSQVSFLWKGWV